MPGLEDLLSAAASSNGHRIFATAVWAAGLSGRFCAPGPLTAFIPTDRAFLAVPQSQLQRLLRDAQLLSEVLCRHLVEGRLRAADLWALSPEATLSGQEGALRLAQAEGRLTVNGAFLVEVDLPATNGVVHLIDQVLLEACVPPQSRAASVARVQSR